MTAELAGESPNKRDPNKVRTINISFSGVCSKKNDDNVCNLALRDARWDAEWNFRTSPNVSVCNTVNDAGNVSKARTRTPA
jgi:hypothetical protein